MLLAIDYDKTYTADPAFWLSVIALAETRGHRFVCVTGRGENGAYGAEVKRAIAGRIPIVFTDGAPKRAAAEQAGYKPAIWIDDLPETIGAVANLS